MSKQLCPECGKSVSSLRDGRCPACLLSLGLRHLEPDDSETPTSTPVAGTIIGRYRLIEHIGEGAFGTVWMAEQLEPVQRRVALKLIKLGMDTREVMKRFEAERQALAMMDHPHIARVFDGGTTETGRPFFVMEWVRGAPITEFCDSHHLPTRERLKLFILVCEAVQHAHQKGVIHRDLKPSNILVSEVDRQFAPKVIDFGVAKALDEPLTEKTLFTRFQQFLGTPAYVSPEQASLGSFDVDTRTDIYSLGVLLYELLIGQTPLDPKKLRNAGYEAMLKLIREEEAATPSARLSTLHLEDQSLVAALRSEEPRRLYKSVRGDLDWITIKALEKNRARRYESATELAADLKRYLANQPIAARPPSSLYRFRKLIRRNNVLVTTSSVAVLAVVLSLLISSWQSARARKEATRRRAYAAEVNVAHQALAENNLARAVEMLDRQRPKEGEQDLRGFEWRHLWQLCQGNEQATFPAEAASVVAFSPNGGLLACSADYVVIRERPSHRIITNFPGAINLSFSPDSTLLALADWSSVKLLDTRTWREARTLPEAVAPVKFSPDGNWMVTGKARSTNLVVWSTVKWSPVGECPNTPGMNWHVRHVASFSPDGKLLVTPWMELGVSGLRLWKVPTLELYADLFPVETPLSSAAFMPDSKHLLTGAWDGRLLVWDVTQSPPKLIQSFHEHSTHVSNIAVPLHGDVFATTSADRTVNLWDLTTRKHLVRLRGHTREVWALDISPDGQTVVSGSFDGTTKLWNTRDAVAPAGSGEGSLIAGFTADSRTFVLGPGPPAFRWHFGDGITRPVPVSPKPLIPDNLMNTLFDVQGNKPLGALGREDGSVELWNLSAGTQLFSWKAATNEISFVKFLPDGSAIATGSADGRLVFWNTSTGAEMIALRPTTNPVSAIDFTSDGKWMVCASRNRTDAAIWDIVNQRELRRLNGHDGYVTWAEFSPDDRLLATCTMEGNEARLWEFPSGRLRTVLKGHLMGVRRVAFSPDGRTLATGGLDGKVRLWNLATDQEIVTLPLPLGSIFRSLCFSPDGRVLAAGYLSFPGERVKLFRAPSFEEIAAMESQQEQHALR